MPRGGHNRIDLTGRQFGRLVVTRYARTINRRACWYCRCDCGNTKVVTGKDLRTKHARSCGCRSRGFRHGYYTNRFYYIYHGMIKRCYNKQHVAYPRYGGRGIKVCAEWRKSLRSFIAWCESRKPPIGFTLDRFPNKNGNYSPSNCRFASRLEQQRNMRSNVVVRYRGREYIYKDFVARFGKVGYQTACLRANRHGMDRITAALTPAYQLERK